MEASSILKKWVNPKKKYKNQKRHSTTSERELNPLLHEKMEFTTIHLKN